MNWQHDHTGLVRSIDIHLKQWQSVDARIFGFQDKVTKWLFFPTTFSFHLNRFRRIHGVKESHVDQFQIIRKRLRQCLFKTISKVRGLVPTRNISVNIVLQILIESAQFTTDGGCVSKRNRGTERFGPHMITSIDSHMEIELVSKQIIVEIECLTEQCTLWVIPDDFIRSANHARFDFRSHVRQFVGNATGEFP